MSDNKPDSAKQKAKCDAQAQRLIAMLEGKALNADKSSQEEFWTHEHQLRQLGRAEAYRHAARLVWLVFGVKLEAQDVSPD